MNVNPSPTVRQIMNDFPRIEWEKISDLQQMDSEGKVIQQLVNIFFKEINGRLPEMKLQVIRSDYESLGKSVHRFRSTTYNLAARRAAEITIQIDVVLAQPNPDRVELFRLVNALETECRAAHQALQEQQGFPAAS